MTSATLPTLSLSEGARLCVARCRGRATLFAVLLSVAAAATIGIVHRVHAPLAAPNQTILAVFSYFVPLCSFAITSTAIGRARLDDSVWCLAQHGLPRQSLAVGLVAMSAALAAIASLLCVVVGLLFAYGSPMAALGDVLTSAPLALLGGAAYASWFAFGATFFGLGRGRWVPLVLDFTVGAGSGVLAFSFPRGHLRSLVGGEAVMHLAQPASSVILAAMIVVLAVLAAMFSGK
jgi:hypothetical protein